MASTRKDRRNESGGVLIELAMVVLPLMVILLGMVEVGGAWRDKSQAIQASRQGARVITTASTSDSDFADREALLAVLAGIPTDGLAGQSIEIRKVIIFDATGMNEAAVQAQINLCNTSGGSSASPSDITVLPSGTFKGLTGECNVYMAGNNGANGAPGGNSLDPVEINAATWTNGNSAAWDSNFDSSDKNNTIAAASEVGVYVEMYRPWVTGFFPGDGMTVSGFTVMTVEPLAF